MSNVRSSVGVLGLASLAASPIIEIRFDTLIKQMKLVDLKIYDSQSDNHGMISETVRSVF